MKIFMRKQNRKPRVPASVVTLAVLAYVLWPAVPPTVARQSTSPQNIQREKEGESASRAFDEAVRLHGEGSPQALESAIPKYEEAIRLWRAAGDELKEARATNNLAAIHHSRGEYPKA